MRILKVKVNIAGSANVLQKDKGLFIVSNHLSYLDVLIFASLFPASFVTSEEMHQTPFLGQMSMLGGSFFVDRRGHKRLLHDIEKLKLALLKGLRIVVFPEATSGNAEKLHHFKRSLFRSAILAKSPVLPLCLNYKTINGEPLGQKNRDFVCWYGKMSFAPHLKKLLTLKSIEVEVTFFPLIENYAEEIETLARKTQEMIESRFKFIKN